MSVIYIPPHQILNTPPLPYRTGACWVGRCLHSSWWSLPSEVVVAGLLGSRESHSPRRKRMAETVDDALRGRGPLGNSWSVGQKMASHLQQPSLPSPAQGLPKAEAKVLLLLRISHHIFSRGQEATCLAGLRTVTVSKLSPALHPALLSSVYRELTRCFQN